MYVASADSAIHSHVVWCMRPMMACILISCLSTQTLGAVPLISVVQIELWVEYRRILPIIAVVKLLYTRN